MDQRYLSELSRLQGKVAVLAGGWGVLCGCMSKAFAGAGAKVGVLDLNLQAAQRVAKDSAAKGEKRWQCRPTS